MNEEAAIVYYYSFFLWPLRYDMEFTSERDYAKLLAEAVERCGSRGFAHHDRNPLCRHPRPIPENLRELEAWLGEDPDRLRVYAAVVIKHLELEGADWNLTRRTVCFLKFMVDQGARVVCALAAEAGLREEKGDDTE